MPSATSLLKQDHRTVEKLFMEFESSGKASIAEQICEELDLHTNIEERVVYPALREELIDGKQMADHAEREHAEARQLIGRIRRTKDEGRLAAVMSELKHAIEEHVQEEENEVFPKMERELGAGRLDEMGRELEELKSSVGS
jgi:iron-sulfur cluster repair protein YtfE (RIC family)